MERALLVIALAAHAAAGAASALTVTIPDSVGAPGTVVEVPLQVSGAEKVGALQLVILYDQSVVSVESVKSAGLASGALLHFRNDGPGVLFVALITTNSINGTGEVATIQLRLTGSSGQSTMLTPEKVEAWEGLTHYEILTTAVAGRLTVASEGLPWWIWLVVAAAVVLLLLVLRRLLRRAPRAAPVAVAGNFCGNCGKPNAAGAKFCSSCGSAIDAG